MKNYCRILFIMIVASLVWAANVKAILAAPHFTLSPASGSFSNGTEFKVNIGVETGDSKSAGVDMWATFDATKLEVVGIKKIANSDYGFAAITPNINNTSGTFTISFVSNNSNPNEATPYTGNFAEVTFKGKASGTASLNFTCSKDFVDSNIIASDTINTDLIDCASNQSGSYTITAGVGGESATAAPTSSTLPQTGATAPTVIMIVVGVVGVLSALVLRWL